MKKPKESDYVGEYGEALTENAIDDYAEALEDYIDYLETINNDKIIQILNHCLCDATCSPNRIKHPNSNEVAKFINKWYEENKDQHFKFNEE